MEHQNSNYKNKHILLVDDDIDDRELFTEAIQLIDPQVEIEMKRDGEELIERLKLELTPPDIIFLDLNMPKKNGIECLQEIRNNKSLNDVPVVIFTTSLNPSDVEETFSRGANRFFRKPNSFQELKEVLGELLTVNLGTSRERDKFVVGYERKPLL